MFIFPVQLTTSRIGNLTRLIHTLGCTVASRGGYQMARGRHYAELSLSNAARLSFSDLCILLFMFLSLCRLCVCVFLCSHWSLVDVPLIFFCPADHVPDWQPRVLLGMVEARSINVKKTTTYSAICDDHTYIPSTYIVHDHTYSTRYSVVSIVEVVRSYTLVLFTILSKCSRSRIVGNLPTWLI